MDNKSLIEKLQRLGVSYDEARIYLRLLEGGASTHLRLSRDTGITRSKVYRIVEQLEGRGLVSHYADDTGRYVAAGDPENLSIQLTVEEEELEDRRNLVNSIVPDLAQIKNPHSRKDFIVREYEGEDGFRQMLWQELKTKGELLVLGGATIEELAPNPRWAERHRAATLEAGYRIRELLNERRWDIPFSSHEGFMHIYSQRYIDRAVLSLTSQIAIFNDTVNIYHWRNQRIGVVIVNRDYAAMMRQFFETHWLFGTEPQDDTLHLKAPAAAPRRGNNQVSAKAQPE